MRLIEKDKKFSIVTIILVLCLSIIGIISNYMENKPENLLEKSEPNVLLKFRHFDDKVLIRNVDVTRGILFKGDKVCINILIENLDVKEREIWLGYSLQDSIGKWYDIEPKKMTLASTRLVEESMEWIIPKDVLTGDYTLVMSVWDGIPSDTSKRLASATLTDSLRIYNIRERFDTGIGNQWLANDNKLGRSSLQSKNVFLQDDKLHLKLPEKTLNGAEIQTKEKVHYGSYEIRMKIPDAPSSITGFFLYDQPDYYHEIDIEIYNEIEAELLLTTYAEGEQAHSDRMILSFDPTSDFHTYRINYLPDRVEFFIDDILLQTWTEGFTSEQMYLMVNTWYPKWLEGVPTQVDQYLIIDWILK